MLYQAAQCLIAVEVLAGPVMEISLGKLFQYLIAVLIMNFFFLVSNWNFSSCKLSVAACPFAVYDLEEPGSM